MNDISIMTKNIHPTGESAFGGKAEADRLRRMLDQAEEAAKDFNEGEMRLPVASGISAYDSLDTEEDSWENEGGASR